MRFISMHTADADTEAGTPPNPELIAGMGQLVGEMMQAGVFEAGEGLRASSTGVRLNYRAGKRSETPGPFTPGNELPAGITLVKVADIEAAKHWADRHAQVFGDVEIDVRPINEPWDIGMMPPPPAGSPVRYMLQMKADAKSEAGTPLTPAQFAALHQLHAEMKLAGVFLAAEGVKPSSQGVRILYGNHGQERRVIDGPFAESKELIAGYCILQVADLQEAVKWSDRFAAHFPQVHVDVRPLYGPADAA